MKRFQSRSTVLTDCKSLLGLPRIQMKRIFGTKKDKEPPKTLEQVSGDLDGKAQEYAFRKVMTRRWSLCEGKDEFCDLCLQVGTKNQTTGC